MSRIAWASHGSPCAPGASRVSARGSSRWAARCAIGLKTWTTTNGRLSSRRRQYPITAPCDRAGAETPLARRPQFIRPDVLDGRLTMGLWKRGRRYWTQTVVNGVWIRRPLCPPGSTRATTNWQEAVALEKELIRAALQGSLPTHSHSIKLFAAIDDYLNAKNATANTQRAIDFDRERLEVVKRVLGDVRLSAISSRVIEGFQAKRRLEGAGNRTVNMDVGALRQVLKRFKQWRRLEDDVKMLTESGGEPIGRVLTSKEQERLLKAAEANPEWEHVWCAAQLAANTSMRGVEVKHVRRKDFDPEK